jgi:hypothetical protein
MIRLILAAAIGGYIARHLTIEEQKRVARVRAIKNWISARFNL